ncbi:hypothetical protein GDO81_016569 [Engystomops pustulosus]|uniref:Uncharacterized protein n=1 Tax=Engystomops pustulosus TaxID=76066 RepID=A0AAV7AT31_ENGPU|nr:hypothetical protein GDO81_016569 [Engystomops pustulosus]
MYLEDRTVSALPTHAAPGRLRGLSKLCVPPFLFLYSQLKGRTMLRGCDDLPDPCLQMALVCVQSDLQ